MAHYQSFEQFSGQEHGNPYTIDVLNQDGSNAYMRIAPPVFNLDGFFETAESHWTTTFSIEQITGESTILSANMDACIESGPDAAIEQVREAAQYLLRQLGAGVNAELFKNIS